MGDPALSTPVVSVVLPVRNGEEDLPRAVESILNQTLRELELIIIDDGSDDGTPEYLRSLTDARVKVIRNKRNLGVYPSRNRAQRMARGEFIAVHDHDDQSRPDRLEKQVGFLRERPGCVAVGGQIISHHPERPSEVLGGGPDDVRVRWQMLFHTPIPHQALMFRRAAADEVGGYREEHNCAMDYDLECRLATFGRLGNVMEPLVAVRQRAAGITLSNREKQRQVVREISCRQMADLLGEDVPMALRNAAEANLWHQRIPAADAPGDALRFCLRLARRFAERHDARAFVAEQIEALMSRCAEEAGSRARDRRWREAWELYRTARTIARDGLIPAEKRRISGTFRRSWRPEPRTPDPQRLDVLIYTDTFAGERERVMRDQVEALQGYNAHVVINEAPPDAIYAHPWIYVLEHPSPLQRRLIRKRLAARLGHPPGEDEERLLRLEHFVRKLKPVLIHAVFLHNASRAAEVAERYGLPLVLTLLDEGLLDNPDDAARETLRSAQCVVVFSEAAASKLKKLDCPEDRINCMNDRWTVEDPFKPARGPEGPDALYDRIVGKSHKAMA